MNEISAELEAITAKLEAARATEKRATSDRREIENSWVLVKAKSMGLQIGSTVTVDKLIGYGASRKLTVRRSRVDRIKASSYRSGGFTIWGRTIRKDSTLGDLHQIYDAWKLEA